MKRKHKKKSKPVKLLEYYAACVIVSIARAIPFWGIKLIGKILGDVLFFLVPKRRNIAIDNLDHVYSREKSPGEISRIARESCRSFVYTFLEIVKFRYLFTGPNVIEKMKSYADNLDELFIKAKKIHDESGGCIFVTPHLGNWEVLPHVCSVAGIPLAIVARPLDNEYLEKLIFSSRAVEGQFIIPKKNALFVLQRTLQKGTSIGMLPDQSTMKGLVINFFGRPATTTPVPAVLAVTYKRPVVVVAACRKENNKYEGFVSDPIWPGEGYKSEKEEILRITQEITRNMESIIRKYPEQYLWMHNRWKTYEGKKEIMS
ncbi:MAG: lysophospholipid acyltransferase family protein [Nitrospirae bacterium]|nr:lysophospholipid acyltransferase family protein [Nitrospirota bacterium]